MSAVDSKDGQVRRGVCQALAGLFLASAARLTHAQLATGAPNGMRTPQSLSVDLTAALDGKRPLIVLVSLDGCPFCKSVRESYLLPLQAETGQIIVQLDMKSQRRVADFSGQEVTHDQLILRWGAKVAPTVLFFGRGGVEVAPRLDGAYLPDFYGSYLDDRLQLALRSVGK